MFLNASSFVKAFLQLILVISPWLPSAILQNLQFPTIFPSNLKQCHESSPPQVQRIQSIPLFSLTYSPGWPGGLPLGHADDMSIRPSSNVEAFI